jgi:phosphoglycolate phosphatase
MGTQKAHLKIRCVIYDCDGVLFDSIEAQTKFYNDLCSRVGRYPLNEEEIQYVYSHTDADAIHFIFGKEKDLEKRVFESLKQVDPKDYIGYLKMEPHLVEALEKLKEKGILRVIDTNRMISMEYIMEVFHLWPHFDMVVTPLNVKNPKPHPESVEKILGAFKLEKAEALFVGDSEIDKQTAESSGVRFVAYKKREIAGDLFIEDHLDLFNLILNPAKKRSSRKHERKQLKR